MVTRMYLKWGLSPSVAWRELCDVAMDVGTCWWTHCLLVFDTTTLMWSVFHGSLSSLIWVRLTNINLYILSGEAHGEKRPKRGNNNAQNQPEKSAVNISRHTSHHHATTIYRPPITTIIISSSNRIGHCLMRVGEISLLSRACSHAFFFCF